MISTYTHDGLTWIDIESPTLDEVTPLIKSHKIHPIVSNEILSTTFHSKVDYYKNYVYLVLHFPMISGQNRSSNGNDPTDEIDFIIGKNFLITTHFGRIPAIDIFRKSLEACSVLERGCGFDHAGALFFYLLRELYKEVEAHLAITNRHLKIAEENIFNGKEGEMVTTISEINRQLLDFKEVTRFHKEVLESFQNESKSLFGKEFGLYTESLLSDYYKIWNIIENQKETVLDLRETNDSLLTSKTNRSVKVLTAITAILLPAALVVDVFGINSKFIPFANSQNEFPIVVSFMILSAVLTYLILRKYDLI